MAAAHSLDTLNLASNHLASLPAEAFAELRAINSLDLESNSLSFLDEKAFAETEGKRKAAYFLGPRWAAC